MSLYCSEHRHSDSPPQAVKFKSKETEEQMADFNKHFYVEKQK